ncbi:MAG: ABC transporter permease [Actinobacteria bacterium]|nr:ABC transporter permease [Actinomycetota bacterium]
MSEVSPTLAVDNPAVVPRRRRRVDSMLLASPAMLFVFVVFVIPFFTFAVYSVLTSELFSIGPPVTLDSYRHAIESDSVRTLAYNAGLIGAIVAFVTVAAALPIAYWLRFCAGRWRLPVLFLITSTVIASYLVRIYAWRSVLGTHGLANSALESLGLIDHPLNFLLFNRFAVGIALVHIFLPYVVLLLYASFGPMPSALLECAQDLGAGAFRRWTRVIIPLMAPPLLSSWMLVFVLSAGDYVTPQLLGGTTGVMIGVEVQNQFKSVGDYASGAAISFLMLGAFALTYALLRLTMHFAKVPQRIEWSS